MHPSEIELGLERVRAVADRLQLSPGSMKTVVVAGTNGKGSTVAALQAIALEHGLSVGAYTSPHILEFNERVQLDGEPVSDASLCQAFSAVEQARGDVQLTYFEFTTLAALVCFDAFQPHWRILEVGLGGRLDAVNIVDADVTLVTNIQLDHEAWLGSDRESIAREKAGVFRAGIPAICAELAPPANLVELAAQAQALWMHQGEHFTLEQGADHWRWNGRDADGAAVEVTGSGVLQLAPDAVAGAIQAALMLAPGLQPELIAAALQGLRLRGRCQFIPTDFGLMVLDVAHNPAAAVRLARVLGNTKTAGKTHVLFAMLADKRADQFATTLASEIDGQWWLPQLQVPRAKAAAELAAQCAGPVHIMPSVDAAIDAAMSTMDRADRLVVTGSFFTVSAVLHALATRGIHLE
jgi:dihydrofolate synthase/folylpolyglutamate synthase